MKILLYGDDSPGSGGWCYAETLREMGHQVEHLGDGFALGHYRTSLPHRVYRNLFRDVLPADLRRHLSPVFERAKCLRPDLVIVLKGLLLHREHVQQLRMLSQWVCNINHDDFFSRNRNNWSPQQRLSVSAYDFIFTTREVNVAELRPFTRRVGFFPFAYYPRIHRVVQSPPAEVTRWNRDIVFVGTYERPRAALLEQLITAIPCNLAIHGAQWHKISRSSPLRPHIESTGLHFDDLCKALGHAKISLGFLRKENRDDYTQRTFEIPACGGVLLAERTPRHMQYYQEGVEAEFFDPTSPTELFEKAAKLLDNAVRRERIRKAGRAAVLSQRHTYRDRLEHLLTVYEQPLPA